MIKKYQKLTLIFAFAAALSFGLITNADAVYVDRDTNPIKMVLTSTGGVSLEAVGQQKYIQVWNRANGQTNQLSIMDTNIQSYDVEGNNVVYTAYRGGESVAYLYNLANNQQTALDSQATMKENIKISGSNVVWVDYAGGKPNVILYNTAATKQKIIYSGQDEQEHIKPVISSRYVAWVSRYNGLNDIFVYDLTTGKTATVRSTVNQKLSLDIYTDKLVWAETREAGEATTAVVVSDRYYDWLWGNQTSLSVSNVWMYNLTTKVTTRLTDTQSSQAQCNIEGNQVAWVDNSSGNPDVQVMDLTTRKVTTIAASDTFEVQPAIGYGYIAWIDLKGNLGDLQVQPLVGSSSTVTTPVASQAIKVVINGKAYTMSPAPYQKSGRVMVPMRKIFELLGATVTWNDAEKSVTAVKAGKTVKLYIGKTTASINGKSTTLDAAPEIKSNSTMIPLRFAGEALGCTVSWDEKTRTVSIKK